MLTLRQIAFSVLICTGLTGFSSPAQTVTHVDPAAARAQEELRKGAAQQWREERLTQELAHSNEERAKQRAKSAAAKSRSASAVSSASNEAERRERLARIEREIERRKAERSGDRWATRPAVNKPTAVAPTPPTLS